MVLIGGAFTTIPALLAAVVAIPEVSAGPASTSGNISAAHHQHHHQHPYQSHQLMDSEEDLLALSDGHRQNPGGLIRRSRRSLDREPRFISFQTKDDNIEVEIDFAIPFLTIPVKKSVDGMMTSVLKGTPLLNINVGAVILAVVLALGGALIGGFARLFKEHNLMTPLGPLGVMRSDEEGMPKTERKNDRHHWNTMWTLLEAVDKSLQKYDIDSTACTQRAVCWYVKEAMNNVEDQRASKVDIMLNGLSSADWALKFTTGTAIEDAIRAGRRNLNCEQAFPACRIRPEVVQNIISSTGRKRTKK